MLGYVDGSVRVLAGSGENLERREVVSWLAGQGMSTRAIAPVVGIKQPQVVKDLAAQRDVIPQESPGSPAEPEVPTSLHPCHAGGTLPDLAVRPGTSV